MLVKTYSTDGASHLSAWYCDRRDILPDTNSLLLETWLNLE